MNYGGICLASTPVLFLMPVDIRHEERKHVFVFAVCDTLLTSLRFDTYRSVVLFFSYLIIYLTDSIHMHNSLIKAF